MDICASYLTHLRFLLVDALENRHHFFPDGVGRFIEGRHRFLTQIAEAQAVTHGDRTAAVCSSPHSISSSDVLPIPFGPTRPIFAPASMLTVTFAKTSNAPKDCPS